jgi:hypothetical protein
MLLGNRLAFLGMGQMFPGHINLFPGSILDMVGP